MHSITFATATWARTTNERNIIIRTITSLSKFSYPIVIGDRNDTDYPLKKDLQRIPNVVLVGGDNFNRQRVKCYTEAARMAKNIFWLESDKQEFVESHLQKILRALPSDEAIVLPAPTRMNFSKYPHFQRVVENCINELITLYVGVKGHFTYGPVFFPSHLARFLEKSSYSFGWGINAFLLVIASQQKIPIKNLFLRVDCPPDVQHNEELKQMRLNQLKDYIIALEEASKLSISS